MFSSNPFSQVPSSSTNVLISSPNSFFDHEKEDDELHFNYHHHHPFISGDILFHPSNTPVAPPPVTENIIQEDHDDLLDSVISPYKKKITSLKKDGHSKIYTARGPRDRRVRLSIEIAKKFFCLQDLLGFDKASKTLDWLLAKSLTAIKDLVEETNCSSSTLTDQSKVKFLEIIKKDSDDEELSCQKKKSAVKFVDGKKKKRVQRCKGGSGQEVNFARDQSRAEARARARERTKEKMRVKRIFDDELKTFVNNISDGCESTGCWGGQIETQSDYQETSKQSKDSSFQNKYLALSKFRAFQEQQGDNNINLS